MGTRNRGAIQRARVNLEVLPLRDTERKSSTLAPIDRRRVERGPIEKGGSRELRRRVVVDHEGSTLEDDPVRVHCVAGGNGCNRATMRIVGQSEDLAVPDEQVARGEGGILELHGHRCSLRNRGRAADESSSELDDERVGRNLHPGWLQEKIRALRIRCRRQSEDPVRYRRPCCGRILTNPVGTELVGKQPTEGGVTSREGLCKR